MAGYEWLPLHIQFWIWGVAALVGSGVLAVTWWRWGRPLKQSRLVLEETDGYRQLAVLEGKHRINQIVAKAEAQIMRDVTQRLGVDQEQASAQPFIEVWDVS